MEGYDVRRIVRETHALFCCMLIDLIAPSKAFTLPPAPSLPPSLPPLPLECSKSSWYCNKGRFSSGSKDLGRSFVRG